MKPAEARTSSFPAWLCLPQIQSLPPGSASQRYPGAFPPAPAPAPSPPWRLWVGNLPAAEGAADAFDVDDRPRNRSEALIEGTLGAAVVETL